ncbi:MAG: cysteine desulfurase [Planctomycetaceae bacterium]|nr:cysteine desulfurase [Planctomycetaceae bacterium]
MTTDRPIYLDNHATTRVDPQVLERMWPFYSERYGNASSISHAYGWDAAEAVDTARSQVARLIGGTEREIVFTSGATEANNLAIKGVMARCPAGSHLIVSAIEHRAILDPARKLERAGYAVTVLPVDEHGRVSLNQLAESLKDNTKLVSIGWANNEIGTIQDVTAIGQLCRDRGVIFHTDAAQAVGKLPMSLANLPIDLMSFTAHKIYGPKGVGALFLNRSQRRLRLEPLQEGGGQERGLRSGTLPVPLIVGFGTACELAGQLMPEEPSRLQTLRNQLWEGLSASLPGLHQNGPLDQRLANNLNVSIEDINGDALMNGLTQIAVSSGSACTSSNPEPSHVLKAIGRNDSLARASLRFGLGRFTTPEDIDVAIDHVTEVVERLRELTT